MSGVPEDHVRRLRDEDTKAFSAMAVVLGDDALIVVNDGHTLERQANSIAHELAHLLLGHPAGPMLDEFGARTLTKDHDEEADWPAACSCRARASPPRCARADRTYSSRPSSTASASSSCAGATT
jgi:hypothetical protein